MSPEELNLDAPAEFCAICRCKHHPYWHRLGWRDAVRALLPNKHAAHALKNPYTPRGN